MVTRPPATPAARDPVADAPVGPLVAIGAALGLLAATLLAAEAPLLMSAGAAIGLMAGLAIDVRRTDR